MEIEMKKALIRRLNYIYISLSNDKGKGFVMKKIADLQYYIRDVI